MKRTKTELKEKAQEEILTKAMYAVCDLEDPELVKEIDKQLKRIEKMFGYEVGSFHRGA